jgi:MFS family permease
LVSSFGNAIAPIALAFAVLDLTNSPGGLGLVIGSRTIANVVFLLFGGVLADRLPRHLVMVGTSVAAGATQAAIATTLLTGTATLAVLTALSALNGLFSAFAMPASAALLLQTVPADERQQANALSRLFLNGTAIVGASAGGVLVAAVGPSWGIAFDAATFFLAALLFVFVRITPVRPVPTEPTGDPHPRPKPTEPNAAPFDDAIGNGSIFIDLRIGWVEFSSRTWLWVVVAGFALINACIGGLTTLGPVVANTTFGRAAWGFVLAAETVGMVAGGLVALRIRVSRLLLFGVVCAAFQLLPLLTLGAAPHLGLLLGAAFIAGAGVEQFGIAWETTMQEHVPAERLARVYSYDMLGSFIAIPIGQVLAGPIAQAVGVQRTLVGAALLIAIAVVGMLCSRDVRHLQHRLRSTADTQPTGP